MYIKMIKRRLLSVIAALVFLLALSGCGAAENEGSVYMNINAEKAKEMMDGLEIPEKDVPVFVYCRSGNRSKTASKALVDLGYSEVYEFGGIIDWPYEIEQ